MADKNKGNPRSGKMANQRKLSQGSMAMHPVNVESMKERQVSLMKLFVYSCSVTDLDQTCFYRGAPTVPKAR